MLTQGPPPFKPTGKAVFVLKMDDSNLSDDWRADGYTWRNNGVRNMPFNIKKHYFKLSNGTTSFVRHAYQCSDAPGMIIIHYLGDESGYESKPHGNAKRNNASEYQRTCPSVIKELKENNIQQPSAQYKKLLSKTFAPEQAGIVTPRNLEQVHMGRYREKQKKKLTHDAIYNMIYLSYELGDFVHEITVFPDLLCVIGLKDIIDEFKKLMLLKSDELLVYCSYDTTFNLGDFYITPILFRHIVLENSPVIPLAFMIHERKYESTHTRFLTLLSTLIPTLKSIPLTIVTDRERGIINAISQVLPNAKLLLCWNHLKRDLKFWLQKHGAKSDEYKVYLDGLSTLLNTNSAEECMDKIPEVTGMWSSAAVHYLQDELLNDILHHAAKFVIDKRIFNPYSGITNNSSEGFNTVIKRFNDWKEMPIDSMLLGLYSLQNYYYLELQRGFCNTGTYID